MKLLDNITLDTATGNVSCGILVSILADTLLGLPFTILRSKVCFFLLLQWCVSSSNRWVDCNVLMRNYDHKKRKYEAEERYS